MRRLDMKSQLKPTRTKSNGWLQITRVLQPDATRTCSHLSEIFFAYLHDLKLWFKLELHNNTNCIFGRKTGKRHLKASGKLRNCTSSKKTWNLKQLGLSLIISVVVNYPAQSIVPRNLSSFTEPKRETRNNRKGKTVSCFNMENVFMVQELMHFMWHLCVCECSLLYELSSRSRSFSPWA